MVDLRDRDRSVRLKKPTPYKPRKDTKTKPKANPPETDPILANIDSLVDVQLKPAFLEMYERGRGNYAAFASDFLDVQLHAKQIEWVHSHPWTSERCLATGNRFGKTFVSAIKALHDCFYQTRKPRYAELTEHYQFLNLSLTIDMARIAWEVAYSHALQSKIFRPFLVADEVKTAPFPTLVIGQPKHYRGINPFRSEYWARSTAKKAFYILGFDFDRINFDEAARDPNGEQVLDEVLRMRVADRDGQIDLTSTAAGKNWFYLHYMKGLNNPEDPDHIQFFSMTGTSYDNPTISHAKVKSNEKVMTPEWIAQNIYGGFSEYANVFERARIEECYKDVDYEICHDYSTLPTFPSDPEGKYLMAIDWALKRDETVIVVARVDKTPSPIVFIQGFSVKPGGGRYSWLELQTIAIGIHKHFRGARCLFDSTGMAGEMIFQNLTTNGMEDHEGYDFGGNNGQAKDHLILVAQQALQNHIFQWPFHPSTVPLVDQLLLYDRQDRNLATDYVFAFALLAENLRRANLPASEILDTPFVYASLGYRYGGVPLSRDSYRIDASDAVEVEVAQSDTISDKFRSENPEMIRVLTSTGYKLIPKEMPVA